MAEFDRIIAELGPALLRVAASYERNPAPRQDLFQEILLAVAQSLPRLREETRLRPFVFRIAHNKGVDHVARHAAEAPTEEISDELPMSDDTPEEELMAKQRTERLTAAVRQLELPYRQAITLLLEGLSYAEIADTLGISVSNVGVRVNRAKTQLRMLLHYD
jgi:RNA polymerase sigma factor (sigma-70 family)